MNEDLAIGLGIVAFLAWAGLLLPLVLLLVQTQRGVLSQKERAESARKHHVALVAALAELRGAIGSADVAARERAGHLAATLDRAAAHVGARADQVARLAGELDQTLLRADASFRALVDSLQDMDNLQTISGEVTRFTNEMAGASAKIESQLATAREVTGLLHEVVAAWSNERAPLESSLEALSGEVERALHYERDERHQLRQQLNALVLTLSPGGPRARE